MILPPGAITTEECTVCMRDCRHIATMGEKEISTEGVRGGLLLYRIMSLPVEEAFGSGALGGELQPLSQRRN